MTATLRDALIAVAGPDAVRDPDPARDRVGAVVPTLVVEPSTAERVTAVLGWASREQQTLVVRGTGTRLGWGRAPGDIDVLLSTRALDHVIAHAYGDLTVTVEAGVTLAELNAVLAEHGQYLPLDPPGGDGMTLGGLLATNESGPLRHRHGTPRDLVIGVQFATTGGVLAKAGGRVVKNVAGYDISKLLAGSFGTLAVIVTATFKLSPLPLDSATVEVSATGDQDLAALVRDMMGSQMDLASCEIVVDLPAGDAEAAAFRLLARCTSRSTSVAPQVTDVVRVAAGQGRTTSTAIDGLVGATHGPVVAQRAVPSDGTPRPATIRVSWMPAELDRALADLRRCSAGLHVHMSGRAALGAGSIVLHGSVAAQAATIEGLRKSATFGNVVIISASAELKEQVDVWGAPRSTHALLVALKQTFDPAGILNAARGPV